MCSALRSSRSTLLPSSKPPLSNPKQHKKPKVGIPGGNAEITLPLQEVVFQQKALTGSIVGGRADMQEMLDFAVAKGIKPKVCDERLSVKRMRSAHAHAFFGGVALHAVSVCMPQHHFKPPSHQTKPNQNNNKSTKPKTKHQNRSRRSSSPKSTRPRRASHPVKHATAWSWRPTRSELCVIAKIFACMQ